MPRRWTNSNGGGGGNVKHIFTAATPVRMIGHDKRGDSRLPDLWLIDQILARNAKIAGREKHEARNKK